VRFNLARPRRLRIVIGTKFRRLKILLWQSAYSVVRQFVRNAAIDAMGSLLPIAACATKVWCADGTGRSINW
jgi:hypothetical protein